MLFIAPTVAFNLGEPVISICGWFAVSARAVVSMPKTAVDEDCLALPQEDYIGFSGKLFAMKAITGETKVAQHLAHDQFG
jgi:hypothetical protein